MGLYTLTTRGFGTILTADNTNPNSDKNVFNDDHQLHVTHTEPTSINSYESSVPQMQIEVNPAPANVPSLASSLADEIARLRASVTQIKKAMSGGSPPNWYTAMASFAGALTFTPAACRLSNGYTGPLTGVGAGRLQSGIRSPLSWVLATPPAFGAYDTVGTMATTAGILIPTTGKYIVGGSFPTDSVFKQDYQLTVRRNSSAGFLPSLSGSITNTEPTRNEWASVQIAYPGNGSGSTPVFQNTLAFTDSAFPFVSPFSYGAAVPVGSLVVLCTCTNVANIYGVTGLTDSVGNVYQLDGVANTDVFSGGTRIQVSVFSSLTTHAIATNNTFTLTGTQPAGTNIQVSFYMASYAYVTNAGMANSAIAAPGAIIGNDPTVVHTREYPNAWPVLRLDALGARHASGQPSCTLTNATMPLRNASVAVAEVTNPAQTALLVFDRAETVANSFRLATTEPAEGSIAAAVRSATVETAAALTAGDVVSLEAFQNSGNSVVIGHSAQSSAMWAILVGV